MTRGYWRQFELCSQTCSTRFRVAGGSVSHPPTLFYYLVFVCFLLCIVCSGSVVCSCRELAFYFDCIIVTLF